MRILQRALKLTSATTDVLVFSGLQIGVNQLRNMGSLCTNHISLVECELFYLQEDKGVGLTSSPRSTLTQWHTMFAHSSGELDYLLPTSIYNQIYGC